MSRSNTVLLFSDIQQFRTAYHCTFVIKYSGIKKNIAQSRIVLNDRWRYDHFSIGNTANFVVFAQASSEF